MNTIVQSGLGLSVLFATILAPLFLFRLFIPWINKGATGSYKSALFLVLVNGAIYGYWVYRVYYEIPQFSSVLLLSLPMVICLLAEILFLVKKKYYWLKEINTIFVICTIPYIFVNLRAQSGHLGLGYEPFLYISVVNLFLQTFLYFPAFALLKKMRPKTPIGFEISSDALTKKEFRSSTEYKQLKKEGLQKVNSTQIFTGLAKYALIIFSLWLYGYIIVP